MTQERTAEISGGGFAGLTMSILLARQGWRVRVHERSDRIREAGAGIFLRNNPFSVLDRLGVIRPIYRQGVQLTMGQMRSGTGHLLQEQAYEGERRLWIAKRDVVIRELERVARDSGVEIKCSSRVVGCDASGVLETDDGGAFRADLIVGADGHGSSVRESLQLTERHESLPTLATRYLVPGRDFAPSPMRTMFWSGRRRVGTAPCAGDMVYVYLICPSNDKRGRQVPIDVDSWAESFPALGSVINQLRSLPADQHDYTLVRCKSWHVGKVVLLGDAAHAQPPTLGHGAGMALTNACALAYELAQGGSVESTLQDWEQEYRPRTASTQRWSVAFDAVSNRWPQALMPIRSGLLWSVGHVSGLDRYLKAADGFTLPAAMLP